MLVLIACLGAGSLGLMTLVKPPQLSLFWPAAGIALAALVCWGPQMAFAIVPAALGLALAQGASAELALLLAVSAYAGPALASLLIRKPDRQAQRLESGAWLRFLLLGVLSGPLLSALLGTASLYLLHQLPASDALASFQCWWGADAIGVLVMAPLLLGLPLNDKALPAQVDPFTWRLADAWRTAATVALLGAGISAIAWVFLQARPPHGQASAWLLMPYALLCGLTLISPALISGLVAMLLTLAAAWSAAHGSGPFVGMEMPARLALLWSLAASAAALPLLAHQRNSALHKEKLRWRATLEALGQGASEWVCSTDGCRQVYACPAWLQHIGEAPDALIRPLDWLSIAHPLDKEQASLCIETQLAGTGPDSVRQTLRLPDPAGDWLCFEIHSQVQERDAQGRAKRLICTLFDVSWKQQAEERQRMSVSLFQHLQEGLLVTDTDFRVLDANPSYCQMMGSSREQLVGHNLPALAPDCLHRSGHAPEQLQQALRQDEAWQGRVQTVREDGSRCHLQLTIANIPEPLGPLRYHVITVSDLTQTLQQQELLARHASTDALTGLPNQSAFMHALRQGLQLAESEGFRLSVCRVDLDQFKQLNQQYGSAVGDALLQQLAQRLQAALRSAQQWSDLVARLNGDEFALLLRSSSPEEAHMALDRLQKVLAQPFNLVPPRRPGSMLADGDLVLNLTASIGATVFPQDNADAETLMRHAGHALYRVKHAGRNGFQLFDTAKHLRDEASLLAIARVQQALDAGELRLFYQPKIDMSTGQVLGMEALLRWQHPDRGLLAPLHFLPLIESTGLAVQVGDWVIEQALKQSASWLRAGLQLQISVNVTARQLQAPDFTQRLQELILRHREPVAQHLCLEVLESAALADVRTTDQLIQSCRNFGVSFALDDFGTGYSTLTYLKRLPVNALKIDRSFVQNMLIDEQDSALVEGVIGLARTFECAVVAEGVESAAHARALLRLGCQQGQGNGIAPAMPAPDVLSWIEFFGQSPWREQMIPPSSQPVKR
ncbi:EAL domain-containing protein [Paucibacter sp. AS339]|uniref:bifunctional diguanylate cyclase/phosphodiesterase n=1 Tax=Paucibacter hankyongi TaxID=3133434 RepID=UPI0030AE2336